MNEEKKPIDQQGLPQFISKLMGKKVVIRLLSGGQPVTGTLEAYDPYELLIQAAKVRSWSTSMPLPLSRLLQYRGYKPDK